MIKNETNLTIQSLTGPPVESLESSPASFDRDSFVFSFFVDAVLLLNGDGQSAAADHSHLESVHQVKIFVQLDLTIFVDVHLAQHRMKFRFRNLDTGSLQKMKDSLSINFKSNFLLTPKSDSP